MQRLGSNRANSQYGKLGSKDHFLDRATDALSVIKISNSFLQTTLGSEDPDEKTAAAFHMIENAVLKIEAFLDSTKQESNPHPLNSVRNTKPSQPLETVHKTSKSLKTKTFPVQELLKMSVPKNVPTGIKISLTKENFDMFGDFYKLVVVITNLIKNSMDAMKNNGGINLSAKNYGDTTVIEVKDSGPGIPEEIIDKVFSSLYTTKHDGTGLGLKMAKTIIESHGGNITVRNNPTTFTIKLPMQ